ncbi:unnamed protein product [Rotaria magnacalcarata]|uniref:Uncharacterized protein n=1 Tax=Rotaria magnacalcarata TaxID=392030 RepID=A0A816ZZA8_9BILA|nr:unnamed protein product [Rotaria magnacalcarata]CAF4407882.1 unnamed protein product [Rotaria magnacalcarata]
MVSTSGDNNPCSICGARRWVLPCDGCHRLFCFKHVSDHRADLTKQLETIQNQHDNLQLIYNQHEKYQEHPLFAFIDVWEHDSIVKIQQTAQKARDELRKVHDEANDQMKTMLKHFNEQMNIGRQNDEYTERELDEWKEQLINIRKQLETPCDIELVSDNTVAPIHMIKINTTKPKLLLESATISQRTQLHEKTSNIQCLNDNDEEITKQQSAIIDVTEIPAVESSESTEPSAISKVETQITLNSSTMPLIESHRLIDPTKTHDLLYLKLTPEIHSELPQILNRLTDHHLHIFHQKDDFLNQLKCCEQAVIFIDVSDVSLNEQNYLLDSISEVDDVYYLYIRGCPSDDDDERCYFFRRYPKIKAMFENEQRLMVQWAVDTANEYKTMGDAYIEKGDKENGRKCFEQEEHKNFEIIFDSHVFCRFTNKTKCLKYVSSRLTNIRLLHFFIPKYGASIKEMKQQYDYPMFVKIFHVDCLATYLRQAAISHFIEQAERRKHEPDEHELALQVAAEFSDALANKLSEYMIEKTC